MNRLALFTALLLPLLASARTALPKSTPLDATARTAAFRAAGATQVGKRWVICREDPSNPNATLDEVGDLNGDGRAEVVVNEGGTFCNGADETSYALLSRQADGRWRVMSQGSGMVETLKVHGNDGWPDLSIGGPGFCFPVLRWNGREYAAHRFEYEGKRCKPVR